MANIQVLAYTDDDVLRHQLNQRFASQYQLHFIGNQHRDKAELPRADIDTFLFDFRVPSRGGHLEDRFVERIELAYPKAQLILVTAEPCPESLERRVACTTAVQLREPVDYQRLEELLSSKLPETKDILDFMTHTNEPTRRTESVDEAGRPLAKRFETQTPAVQRMLSELEVAASHEVTILLIGETGAGKTFLSSLIHEMSPRKQHPFLPVACGALPSELIESELFGHVKGAFTSAHADKVGKFLAAGSGTILLDEIDVLGPEQQVKLLRVIETGQFEPVGSNQTFTSQARLVVASNLALEPLVEKGQFRPDLYYRLNMLKFELPPLRRRQPDIIPLAQHFIEKFSRKHLISIDHISEGFWDKLTSYPWPGNVRELENVMQRAVIYCKEGMLTEKQLPSHIVLCQAGPTNDPSVSLRQSHEPPNPRLGSQLAFTEQEIIEQALHNNNQSRTKAAQELGISRVTLYNKMKKYGMSNSKN